MSFPAAWAMLFAAGGLEVVFAVGLKHATGLDRPWLAAGTALALVGSLSMLTLSLRQLPVGTAYAVWTGIGAAGTALVGIALLGESASVLRLLSIALIILGAIGLKWIS